MDNHKNWSRLGRWAFACTSHQLQETSIPATSLPKGPAAELPYSRVGRPRREHRAPDNRKKEVTEEDPEIQRRGADYLGHRGPSSEGLGKDTASQDVLTCQEQAFDAGNRDAEALVLQQPYCVLVDAIGCRPAKVILVRCRRPDVN